MNEMSNSSTSFNRVDVVSHVYSTTLCIHRCIAKTWNPTEIRCNHGAPSWSILGRRKVLKDAPRFQREPEHLCLPQDRTTLADGKSKYWRMKSENTWVQAVGNEPLMQTKRWHSGGGGACGSSAVFQLGWGLGCTTAEVGASTCPGLPLNARKEMVRKGSGSWPHRKLESIVLGLKTGKGGKLQQVSGSRWVLRQSLETKMNMDEERGEKRTFQAGKGTCVWEQRQATGSLAIWLEWNLHKSGLEQTSNSRPHRKVIICLASTASIMENMDA